MNPHAGGGRAGRELPAAVAALDARRIAHRVHRTTSLEHGRELARAAVAAGATPVTLSGDGLAGAVADAIRGAPVPMGILPGGRGNDFARKLGIPADLEGAVAVLAAGAVRTVDLAEVDGRAYLGIASLGFDSDVQVLANATRLPLGGQVYAYAAVRTVASWRHARFTVTLDGQERSFSGWSVAACNSGVFGGGMYLAPDASLDDGLLDVVLGAESSKLTYLRNLPKVFRGTHLDDPHVTLVRGRELHVATDRPFAVFADGDPIGATPCTIRALPGALRVIAP